MALPAAGDKTLAAERVVYFPSVSLGRGRGATSELLG